MKKFNCQCRFQSRDKAVIEDIAGQKDKAGPDAFATNGENVSNRFVKKIWFFICEKIKLLKFILNDILTFLKGE